MVINQGFIAVQASEKSRNEIKLTSKTASHPLKQLLPYLNRQTIPSNGFENWSEVDRIAAYHKVSPSLYSVLLREPNIDRHLTAIGLTQTQFQSIQQRHHGHLLQCLTSVAELYRLLNKLQQAHCEAIVFKGPILSQLAYGNLTARSFRDLDFLVSHQDYLRVKMLLEAEGYHAVIDGQPSTLEDQEAACWAMGEYAMVHLEKGIWLDIHCQLVGQDMFAIDLPLIDFFKTAQPLNIQGRSVLTFSPEYTFLHLCINSAKEYWPNLQASQDLLALIDRHPNLDWDLIHTAAKKLKIQRLVGISLLIAQRYFEAKSDRIPRKMLEMNDRIADWVADRIIQRQMTYKPLGLIDRILCRLGSIETWKLRCNYLMIFPSRVLRIVFGSNHRDRQFIELPAGLRFLYFVIRPIRLITQYGMNGLKLLF